MGLHFGCGCLVLAAIEGGLFSFIENAVYILKKNRIPPKEGLQKDADVAAEETRVATAAVMNVKVHQFRKLYPSWFGQPTLAVERASFDLDYGECFALLGINGAGKSTTFKSLTCETVATAGSIVVNGLDVYKDFS